jgi:hypothetical protein
MIGGPDRDRTDDLFHAISATSRNSLKLHGTDRTLHHALHAFFPLLDLFRTSANIEQFQEAVNSRLRLPSHEGG